MRRETRLHDNAERRGESLPARLRLAARRGVTLVELLVSMLILAIVCVAWLEIIGIQSARKEARRREAVERLAGMMDAFLYLYQIGGVASDSYYPVEQGNWQSDTGTLSFGRDYATNIVHPMFEDGVSPIGYQLKVVSRPSWPDLSMVTGWSYKKRGSSCRWLVGSLYNDNGKLEDVGTAFFTLTVCLGF